MASVLSANIDLLISSLFRNTLDLNIVDSKVDYRVTQALAEGAGAGQANQRWHDRRQLISTSEEIDLAGGETNEVGEPVTVAKIKALVIYNRNTGTGENLTIGGAAAYAFVNWVGDATDKIVLGPKSAIILINPDDGYAVTADTGDLLKIDSGGNTVDYDIVLIGVKA